MPASLFNAINFRDFGGCAAADGFQVKTGMLFRSASLDHLHGRNRLMVLDARLRTIIDLRPDTERASRVVLLPGVRRITIPLDVDRITRERFLPYLRGNKKSDDIIEAIVSVYRDIVTLTAPAVRPLFAPIADPAAYPLCINCRAGKDRTGYAAALILRTLGVADDDIVRDYLWTNRNLLPRVRRFTRPLRILSAGLLPVRALEAVLTAHEAALRASFGAIDGTYGGTEGFLDFCGVDATMRSRIRETLLEKKAPAGNTPAGA
jgi:protein-tyrosine phosphatase